MSAFFTKIGAVLIGIIAAFSSLSAAQPGTTTPPLSTTLASTTSSGQTMPVTPATPSAPTATQGQTVPASQPSKPASIVAAIPTPAAPPKNLITPASQIFSITDTSHPAAAVVNILCLADSKTGLPSITGSGTVISSDGVILTNAHIAQYLLLQIALGQQAVDCVLRSGDPAVFGFNARLLYISPNWVYRNASDLTAASASGTGEDDFALLLVGDKIASGIITSPLALIPADPALADTVTKGSSVTLYGYPTNPSIALTSSDALHEASDSESVGSIASFGSNTLDFLTIPSAPLAARGSSGGPVIYQGKVVGMISNIQAPGAGGTQNVGAITLSHINRSMLKQSGVDLLSYIGSDLSQKADQFDSYVAPTLAHFLLAANAR